METRTRAAPPPPVTSAAAGDPPPPAPAAATETLADPPRRRALKRKTSSSNSILSPAPPPKRLIKERNALNIPSLHNGPWTRATRYSPVKSAAAPSESATSAAAEVEVVEMVDLEEEEEEEEVVDAEFEMVRSRGREVHVVPTPAGWFSWTEVHPIEKHTLASFFNGKSESRTPEIYMEIRNLIMRKFHANPQTQLELKDLEEISISDSDANQEVMEFLEHWGLINFHPFPPENPDVSNLDDGEDKTASLLEKLYQFETVQPRPRFVTKKVDVLVPAATPQFLPESSIAEELAGPVGPSVEYHCNSCSADCSRKRYHCQKQADFDLCTECYKNEKFGSNMAPSDFILMEPAEVPGVSGGSWTDQETLLLLEALELFSENWNEIAEHVATKTKAQCILHFLQMPIEDPFLEGSNNIDDNIQEQGDPDSANIESTASEVRVSKEIKNEELEDQALSMIDFTKEKDASEVNVSCENGVNIAIDALKAAFHAVGYMPEQEELPSFADAGNPVMALATFLTRLVETDAATNSFRSSLNAMSEDSPSVHLATRHCFILEDPPNDKKDLPALESAVTDTNNGDAPKEQDRVPVANGNDELNDGTEKNEDVVCVKNEECASMETDKNVSGESEMTTVENDKHLSIENAKSPLGENEKSPSVENEKNLLVENGKSPIENEQTTSVGDEKRSPIDNEKNPPTVNEENQSVSLQDCLEEPSAPKESSVSVLPSESVFCSNKDSSNPTLPGEQIGPGATKDGRDSGSPMVLYSTNPNDSEAPSNATNEISDIKSVGVNKPDSIKDTSSLASVDVAEQILDTPIAPNTEPPSEEQESKQKIVIDSTVECAEIPDGNDSRVSPSNKGKNDDSMGTNDDQNNHINKLKRAAVTVLSAAAVKAKLLANQEEDHIRQLVSLIIEKQLRKLEVKLAMFTDIENVILRMREQTERARHRLMHERAQIIAARLGLPASARANPLPLPANKSSIAIKIIAMDRKFQVSVFSPCRETDELEIQFFLRVAPLSHILVYKTDQLVLCVFFRRKFYCVSYVMYFCASIAIPWKDTYITKKYLHIDHHLCSWGEEPVFLPLLPSVWML